MATKKNWLADIQKDAQRKREGGGGFFENLGGLADMVKELPGGLAGFAGSVDRDLTNLLGAATAIPGGVADRLGLGGAGDFISGMALSQIPGGGVAKAATDLKRRDEGGLKGIQERMLTNDPNLSVMQNIDAKLNSEVPSLVAFPKGIAETGKTTTENIAAVASGNAGDAPYAKAWNEGRLFPQLINDIGNVAAVGELGGGMLTRASQSATRAETAAQVAAGDFSRLPSPPPAATMAAAEATASPVATMTTPVQRVAAETSRIGERLAPYAPQLRAVEDVVGSGTDVANKIAGAPITAPLAAGKGLLNIAEANIPQVANAAEMARTGIRNYGLARATQGGVQAESSAATHPFAADVTDSVDWFNKNLTPAEQEAVIASRAGWGRPEMLAQDRNLAAAAAKGVEVPEWGPARETWDVLHKVDEARAAANPTAEQQALLTKMDEASQRAEGLQSVQDDRLATGYGRKNPGDPDTLAKEAFGNEPVEPWVQSRLDRDQQYQAAKQTVDAAGDNAVPGEGVAPEVAKAQAKIAERERWAREHPMSAPADWRDAIQNSKAGQKAVNSVADELEAIDPELAAQLRESADQMPVTIDQMLDAGWDRPGHVYAGEFDGGPTGPPGPARSPRLTKTSGEFTRDSGPARDFTSERFFGEMLRNHHLQNVNEIIRQGITKFAEERPAVLDDVLDQTNSAEGVVKEMRRQGYEPVDAQTLTKQDAAKIDLEGTGTVWVPKGVYDGFESARNEVTGTPYKSLQMFDKAQGVWKTAVLPLNPRWLVGNVGGNAILAGSTLGARDILNPQNWKSALEAIRNPDEHVARLLKRGAAEADLGQTLGEETIAKGGKLRRGARKVVQKSYEMNGVVDDFARTFIYTAKKAEGETFLADLKRLKDEGAITQERFDALSKMPEKIRGNGPKAWTDEAAIQQALNYAGDFTNLSKFERNVVRRVMPFYAWNRHITQLAFRLPLENPYRVAWTLKLADMYRDDDEAPDWLKGAVNLGGGNFLRSSMNPYGGTVGGENPFFNPAQMLASTTPAIQVPLAAMNISGRGPIKGPDYKPQWIGAGSMAGYLTNMTPVTRLAADLIQGPYARGMDRSPVLSRGRPIENEMLGGRWAPLGNYLTGLSVAQIDPAEEARKAAKKKRDEQRKSRR